MKLILTILLIIFNITPTYAQSSLILNNRYDNFAVSSDYSDFNYILAENLKQIAVNNYKADISKLESINPDSDKILLIDLESGETREVHISEFNLLKENNNLTPIAVIKDNITYLDMVKLDNIVNKDIKRLTDIAESIAEKDIKYYGRSYLLIGGFIVLLFIALLESGLGSDSAAAFFVIISLISLFTAIVTLFVQPKYKEEYITKFNNQVTEIITELKEDYPKEILEKLEGINKNII